MANYFIFLLLKENLSQMNLKELESWICENCSSYLST